VLQVTNTEDPGQSAHLNGLAKDFNDRRTFWATQDLPNEIRKIVDQRVIPDAQAIFEAINTLLLPVLRNHSNSNLQGAVDRIGSLYARHRAGVDELVKLANASVEVAEASATASETFYLRVTYGALALTLAVAIATTILLVGMIARPISRMTGAVRALAAGNIAVEIPARGRRDEVGHMAEAVQVFKDNMVETGRLRTEQEQQRQRAEADKHTALASMADRIETETTTALHEVGTRTTAMTATAEEMSASATRTGISAQSAADASAQALANAQTVASAAEELSASIHEIGAQVAQSTAIVGRAVVAGAETRATIEALNEQVGRIGAVADMIGEIQPRPICWP
jgi:methyl-accepting chemotaxis protein